MSKLAVVLQNVVVGGSLSKGDLLRNRQDIRQVLVRKLMHLFCVIWTRSQNYTPKGRSDNSADVHFGITNECPLESGMISTKAKLRTVIRSSAQRDILEELTISRSQEACSWGSRL